MRSFLEFSCYEKEAQINLKAEKKIKRATNGRKFFAKADFT